VSDVSRVSSALERLRFGPSRTLNLREGLPSGAEAARRAETWLRSRQAEGAREVLIITGRGARSPGGVPVVRDAVARVLRSLRRQGVVSAVREHTAGSVIVTVAPLRALFEAAPSRHAAGNRSPRQPSVPRQNPVAGLDVATQACLRRLAVRALESLGVRMPRAAMIDAEARRQFSLLVRSVPPGQSLDAWLRPAIDRALQEFDEGEP
jgi:hypothetical protein